MLEIEEENIHDFYIIYGYVKCTLPIFLAKVPVMAIKDCCVLQNNSITQDGLYRFSGLSHWHVIQLYLKS